MKNISAMEKIFDDSLYRDPRFFRVNELEDHAYFIPFHDPENVRRDREESKAFYSLNGIWKFRWEPSVYQMEAFYEKEYPLEGFSEVAVPENWQLHGVDRAQYQSSPYTFIFDPPHVPEKNPAAAYCREFDFSPQEGKRYELHFEGKDSCIYVWLNGSFVGYGEAPHCDSAFDITSYLAEGRNRLCVMVLKWCSGSYLDDQDKLRLSGLFRDIYILERNPAGIRDFKLTTANDGTVNLAVEAGAPVEVQLLDRGRVIGRGRILLPGENCEEDSLHGEASWGMEDLPRGEVSLGVKGAQNGEIMFTVENPVLWSAEKPYLYEVILSCDGEHMLHRFGFREVCIRDGVFMVNDRPVKLYGVNRHDANPDTGYVVDVAFMKKELLLMKQHNINAIRTAHYPNDPRFYELCDELGFYVLSEADLEFHGCHYVEGWAELQEKPMYGPAIHDRIARMMTRLKNYTCIVIWSLGNESSWGNNLKQEAYYARKADTTRLLHYERAFTEYASMSGEEKKELNGLFDFYCQMYTTLEKVDRIFEDESIQIPYLLSEYSHAMGNSCGDLGFYDDIFQKDSRYAGGFVWEWCDHGIRKQDEAGREYMAYGGDFGERHHLWNVCQDGLVSPDRVPHSALDELKAVYAPVQVERDAQGRVFLRNRNAFTDLEEYEVCWKIAAERESAPVCKRVPYGGTLSTLEEESVSCRLLAEGSCVLSCEPGAWAELPLEIKVPGDCLNPWIEVKVRLKEDTAWAPRGHVVAAWGDFLEAGEQQNVGELQEAGEQQTGCPETAEQKPAGCTLQETRSAYIVSGKMESGEDYTYIFRKDEGVLSQVILHGQELLKAPMTLNCFRAPTDNDYRWRTGIAVSWNKTGEFGNIEYPELLVKNFRAEADEEGVRLKGDFIFSVQGRCAISRGRITYRIGQDGRLTISQKGSIAESLPYWLPRYGYTFVLREDMDRIQYLGWGEKECYEDKRRHALPGIHTYTCDDLAQMYERPQEWGSHCDTRWVKLQGAEAGMKISGEKFSFGASHYDMHQAAQVPHRKDLVRKEALYLYVDYRMSGVGSASVGGQPPVPECRINPGEAYDFTIEILPM